MVALHERLHTLRWLWRHPRMEREDLVAFQNRKLRRLIDHAYAKVPYCRQLFDRAGLKPQDIRRVEDLRAVPVTSRQDVTSAPLEQVLARGANPNRLVLRRTSGSSGQPISVYRTKTEEHLLNMFRLRAQRQFGVRIGDRIALVATPLRFERNEDLLDRLRQALGVYRRFRVDCRRQAEEIVAELDRLNPDVIGGYPGALAHIAPLVAGGRFPGIKPRILMCGGESLVPFLRRRIEDSFGARLLDTYGSHEFNVLAWECPATGLCHVCDDNLVLEILRNGRPAAEGERGEVVGTALHSYTMPFIRYRLGDIVTKGPETCPCGQPFSTLNAIQGRMLDYFPLPGGRFLHPYDLTGPLFRQEASWLAQYQMTQEREDLVVFRAVASRPPQPEELERTQRLARQTLGPGVEFRVEIVERIAWGPEGKFRPSRSLVKSHYDGIDWERLGGAGSAS